MGNNRNKNRNKGGSHQAPPKQQTYKDEYNLEDNFKKVRQYVKKTNRPKRYVTEQEDHFEGRNRIVNSSQSTMNGPTESDSWNKYTRLDDKITDYQSQNEDAHNQIRKDLGNKIESDVRDLRIEIKEKLSIKWYSWTIAALVAIATLFYVLSYSGVLNKQEEHSKELKELNLYIKETDNHINHLQNDVGSIKESLPSEKTSKKK